MRIGWKRESRRSRSGQSTGNVHNIFVDGYLRDPSVSLTIGNTRDVYYGAAFMLLLYAFENHGGREFIRELARQDLLGIDGINAAFAALGRSERFADVFQNWAIANYANDIRRGQIFGYENLPNKSVNRGVERRVNSYPTIRADSLEDWGVRYVTFQNLPPQLEIALDGAGKGEDVRTNCAYSEARHPNDSSAAIR